jgi:hypothetical protein
MRALIAALMLAGCVSSDSTPHSTTCGTITPYSHDFQAAMSREIAPLPEDDVLLMAVKDLKRMRDEARACQEAQQ